MGIGSGLGASFGVIDEVTYGTALAVTRFHEVNSVSLKKKKEISQGGGLAAGRLVQLGTRRVVTAVSAAGTVEAEMSNKGYGILLRQLMGSSAIAQQGATAAWLQTHTFADNVGKFFTAQAGIPDTGGTARPYTYHGGKVLSAEFSSELSGQLMGSWDLDFQTVTEAEALAAPSFPAATAPFVFNQLAVKLGTYGAEVSVVGVKKATVKIERPQNVERQYAGNAGLKAEPIMNDWGKITGSFEVDYITKADFADRFASDAATACVVEWVGPIIASTFRETFRIKIPQIFFETDTPTIDGPDITSGTFSFTAQFDGTNAPAIIEYMSSDVAF